MNEYSSLVMGFGFFTACFAVTLAHIRWTKKQAAVKAQSTSREPDLIFKNDGNNGSAGSGSLAHR